MPHIPDHEAFGPRTRVSLYVVQNGYSLISMQE